MLSVNGNARVRSALAPLNGEHRVSAPQISQLVAGQVVALLEQSSDWWKVRGPDDYEGWMHTGYLEASDGDEQNWRLSLGATVRENTGIVRNLPLNARIAADVELLNGTAINANEVARRFPKNAPAIVDSAVTFFAGASYLWGGVTPWGCDCSGLVQTVASLHGVKLPRDAWQQASTGIALSTASLPWNNTLAEFHAGDVLFFSDREDRRITHVGLAMFNNQFIHSGIRRGGVRIEQMDSDEAYVQQLRSNFVCARRLLD